METSFAAAAVLLFLVVDPLGNIPLFSGILNRYSIRKRRRIIVRETIISFAVLLVFMLMGKRFLQIMHLTEWALQIGGAVVLFLIALKMIFPPSRRDEEPMVEPFIVPLATPMVAGPSVLATLLVLVSTQPEQWWNWLVALLIAWGITSAVLLCAPAIARVLKEKGSMAVERLMGMLLVMVAVQMFLNGIEHYLQH